MLEPKTTPDQSDLALAASIIRLFAASRPLVGKPDNLVRGRYEGEQAACSFLADLFEQMDKGDRSVAFKLRDMG